MCLSHHHLATSQVVLLLLLPLLALAAKNKNRVLGGKCGKKNANPNIICEASTRSEALVQYLNW